MTVANPSIIKNNVFINNGNYDINASEDSASNINNNYIDTSNVFGPKLLSSNIFSNVVLGFVDEINGNYHLTAISDLIDTGTNDYADKFIVDGVNYLAYDYEENNRSVGANMDIGIYEFTTSKPTINSFTHSEDAKTLQETSFTVEYVLSDGREISEISFDYLNDGTFSTEETHIFSEAKTYQITAKVTDDSGEFSLRTIAVIVSALPYDEMTDAQRLINATNPLHYEDILSIIEQGKVDAEDAGILEGKVTGEEYVLNNLTEFNLIDKSTVEFTTASLATLPIGWSLVGISLNITDLSVFDDATIVWSYDNSTSSWGAYSSDAEMKRKITDMPGINLLNTIPAGSGVWIEK